jgi:AraC-like DNA-binding protein
MSFSNTQVSSNEWGKITLVKSPLPNKVGSQWKGIGSFGSINLTALGGQEFKVWHMKFLLYKPTTLTLAHTPPKKTVGLSFSLKRTFHYIMEDGRAGTFKRNQYNLIHLPQSRCVLPCKVGDYESFGIEFMPDYLTQIISKHDPLIADFVQSFENNAVTFLSSNNAIITTAMMDIIQELTHFQFPETMKQLYLHARVMELLRLSVENMVLTTKYHGLPAADVRKLEEVKAYLVEHLYDPGSFRDIALRMGINECKLKTGFKKLFGSSVMEFVYQERLNQAKELITKTDLPIKVIAQRAGYRSTSNFTTAFRKRFGYAPGTLQRGDTNDWASA